MHYVYAIHASKSTAEYLSFLVYICFIHYLTVQNSVQIEQYTCPVRNVLIMYTLYMNDMIYLYIQYIVIST